MRPNKNHSDRKGSQNDLYTRLGLLLGSEAKRSLSSSTRSRSCSRGLESAVSVTSLAALDTNNFPSSNTSPVSTLTGKEKENK